MTATLHGTARNGREFEYTTIDATGKRTRGRVTASNETTAAQTLRQQGIMPLSLTAAGTGLNREIAIPGLGGRTTLKDLSVFSRQFATMTASGMNQR